MTGKYRLQRSFKKFDQDVVREVIEYPGVLGVLMGGQYLVEVPNRPGYYYVRLLNNLSELIVAFNNGKISPVYDLPVLVTRNLIDKNRWYIAGRDAGRYGNWGSTAYIANHGAQHSFDPVTPGNDPVWVWGNQFMPMNTVPSGSNGSLNVVIEPSYYYINGVRKYIGLTGSPDLSSYKPTTSGVSRFILLYADSDGNPGVIVGSDFSHVISGTYGVNPYIPGMGTTTGIPMKAIRLETGTSYIAWASMYDVRPFFDNGGGGSGGGSASGSIVGYTPERLVFTNVSGTMTTDKLMAYDQRINNDPYRNSVVIGSNTINADMQQFGLVVVDNYGENSNSGSGSFNYPMGVFTYADAPVFDWYYAEGTQANPNNVLIDTGLLWLQTYAYNSGTSNYLYLGGMDVFTAEDIGPNSRGIRYEFRGSTTGTNAPNTVMLSMSATYAKFNGLIQVPATNAYYWGEYNVTGSWRQMLSGDSMIWQKNINGSWVTITSMSPGTYTSGSAGDAFTAKVSSADTTADYLYNKISGSSGITITKANPGGNESLVITATAVSSVSGAAAGVNTYDVLWAGFSGSVASSDRFRFVPNGTGNGVVLGRPVSDPASDYSNYQHGISTAYDSSTGTNARGVGIFASTTYPNLSFYRSNGGFSGTSIGTYVASGDQMFGLYGYGVRQDSGGGTAIGGGIELYADADFRNIGLGSVYGTTMKFRVRDQSSTSTFIYPLQLNSLIATFAQGVSVPETYEYYWGAYNVTGSWRLGISDDTAIFEKNVSGSWVEQITLTSSTREVLTANRTYYVRTDGSDNNNGRTNTAGGAFLTVQKAVDVVATLDTGGYVVTIQIADGTYTGAIGLKNVVGFANSGDLVIQGNNGTPANVVLQVTSASQTVISATGLNVVWAIKDLKLVASAAANCSCITASTGAVIWFYNLNFGAATSVHIYADGTAQVICQSNYTISGNAAYHMYSQIGARIQVGSKTVTISANLTFTAFAYASNLGFIYGFLTTYSLGAFTVTGSRYSVLANSVINTLGGGANYFPGNSAGTTASGGQYL